MVELEWFGLRQTFPADFPHNLLSVMSALPESRPRRFGDVEPLAGDYDTSGEEGFVAAWRSARLVFGFTGTPPFIDGSFPPDVPEAKFWSMSASILADSLRDPAWELAVRRFFVAVVDAMPAFYASAAMARGYIWTGRSLHSDSQTDFVARTLDPRDGWLGLPREPRWLAYLGQPYLDIPAPTRCRPSTCRPRGPQAPRPPPRRRRSGPLLDPSGVLRDAHPEPDEAVSTAHEGRLDHPSGAPIAPAGMAGGASERPHRPGARQAPVPGRYWTAESVDWSMTWRVAPPGSW